MNESDFIRQQIALERRHFDAVKHALAGITIPAFDDEALVSFCTRCVEYLVFIATRMRARDQAHLQRLRARLPAEALGDRCAWQAVETALYALAAATDALAGESAHALGSSPRDAARLLRACRDYVNLPVAELRGASQSIYHLCNEHYSVEDWRQTALVTADWILQERSLYAGVRAAAPAGVTLES